MANKIIVSIVVLLLLLIAPAAVYVFGVLGWDGLTTRAERNLWHERARALFGDIRPQLTQDEVIEIAKKHGWSGIRTYVSDQEIRLYAPIEFGASNWVIILRFSGDKLSSVRVKTEDNLNSRYKPKGAPEDIVYSQRDEFK